VTRIVADYAFTQKNYDDAAKYFEMIKGEESKKSRLSCFVSDRRAITRRIIKKPRSCSSRWRVLTPLNAEVFKILFDIASHDSYHEGGRDGIPEEATLTLRPGDAAAQKTLADMLYDHKDFAGALAAYRLALKADPGIRGIYKQYVEIVMKEGDEGRNRQGIDGGDCRGRGRRGDVQRARRIVSGAQGAYAKAIEMYQKVAPARPEKRRDPGRACRLSGKKRAICSRPP
jgi:tetratricopeptide (TPR) repeat protein